MDRPSAEDGASETVEEGDDDISRTASTGRKPQRRSLSSGKSSLLVEDVRNLGLKYRIAEQVFCEAGRSPSGYFKSNFLNRRMRTRMSGGVGGEGRTILPPLSRLALLYSDGLCVSFSNRNEGP